MFANIQTPERKARIIAGVVFMGAGFIAPIPDLWHAASINLGLALLITAALGFCPFKAVLRGSVS